MCLCRYILSIGDILHGLFLPLSILTLNCIIRGYHGTQRLVFRLSHLNATIFLVYHFCNCLKSGCTSFGEKKNEIIPQISNRGLLQSTTSRLHSQITNKTPSCPELFATGDLKEYLKEEYILTFHTLHACCSQSELTIFKICKSSARALFWFSTISDVFNKICSSCHNLLKMQSHGGMKKISD